MTSDKAEQAHRVLLEVLKMYNRGIVGSSEVRCRLYVAAAYFEPEQLIKLMPEPILQDLLEEAVQPMLKREEDIWFGGDTGILRQPEETEESLRAAAEDAESRYQGRCRIHAYLNKRS